MTLPAAVAVDVGGTKIRAGSVIDGVLAHVRSVPTPATAGAQAVLDTIAEAAAAVIADTQAARDAGTRDARAARGAGPRGAGALEWRIGVGSAGVIDPAAGVVVSATESLTGWAGTRLTAELEARTNLPVRAVNDVHAHALGEAAAGASRETRSSLLVAAGTGIGGGVVIDGRLLTGRNSAAGHIGHIPSAAAAGLPCPCGGTGHVEAIASGPAILATYRRLLRDNGAAPTPADTQELAAAASAGDPLAGQAFDTGARALGSALGGIANVLSPEVIVIGGGLATMGETWWAPLRESFAAELIPATAGLALRRAELGQDAALIGAAGLWEVDRSLREDGSAPSDDDSARQNHGRAPRDDEKEGTH